jgi:hypothetical protein
MSFGNKNSPTFDEGKANIKFDPLKYQQSEDYRNTLKQIGQLIGENTTQPIFDLGKGYATNVMGESYQAFTPEQQQKMVDDQVKQAQKGFSETRNTIGSRLANQGLAGSGVSEMDWSGQAENENKAIADIVSNVANQNIAATRQDKAQAVNLLPSLASMSQIPLQNTMAYSNILGRDEAASNAWEQWNTQMNQAVQMANSQAYRDWWERMSKEAHANQNAFGRTLGGLIGKGGGGGE